MKDMKMIDSVKMEQIVIGKKDTSTTALTASSFFCPFLFKCMKTKDKQAKKLFVACVTSPDENLKETDKESNRPDGLVPGQLGT